MTVELEDFKVKVNNRVQEDGPRKTSKFTIGSQTVGYFSSHEVDLVGLDKNVVSISLHCVIRYGFSSKRPHRLVSEMAGEGIKKADGKYEFNFWDTEKVE